MFVYIDTYRNKLLWKVYSTPLYSTVLPVLKHEAVYLLYITKYKLSISDELWGDAEITTLALFVGVHCPQFSSMPLSSRRGQQYFVPFTFKWQVLIIQAVSMENQ